MFSDRSPYEIRAAVVTDCDALAVMRRRLQQVLEREGPALWRMTQARNAELAEFYAQCIADVDVRVLVAALRGSDSSGIVGTAVGRVEVGRDVARFGSIEDVWVEPAYRGRGICRALVAELTRFFQAQGVRELSLGFVYGGTAAAFWQSLGFVPSLVIANADVDAVSALACRSPGPHMA